MRTLANAIVDFGHDVHEHLDRELSVPVSDRVRQGDVYVRPSTTKAATTLVAPEGYPVVRGENGGNTHRLHGADGPIFFDARTDASATQLALGTLTVPEGSTAYLGHPEHGYAGLVPGTYEIRRQREQAEELRIVAD
jgi:hypothetical protein